MSYENGKLVTYDHRVPYTNPFIKNPTYPVWVGSRLVEMTAQEIAWANYRSPNQA